MGCAVVVLALCAVGRNALRGAWRFGCAVVAIALALGLRHAFELVLLFAAALPAVLSTASGRKALLRRVYSLAPLLLAIAIVSWLGSVAAAAHSGIGLIPLRALAAAAWMTWLTHDQRASEMQAALRAFRLPEGFIELLFTTRLFGQQLRDTLEAAWAAGVLRGGLLSLRGMARTVGEVAGVVLVRSIDRSERVAIASALRGAGLTNHRADAALASGAVACTRAEREDA